MAILARAACVAAAIAALAVPQSAAPAGQVYLVDDDGGRGVHFRDLPEAFAAAQPGDVVLVRAGSYTPFVLDKGLRVLGEPGVQVSNLAPSRIGGVPAGQTAVLRLLSVPSLLVEDCAGAVLLQELDVLRLEVRGCADVRAADLPPGAGSRPQVVVLGSRLELRACDLRGARGLDSFGWGDAGPGEPALEALEGARVHADGVTMRGGDGGMVSGSTWNRGGDGGPGVRVHGGIDPARVLLAGATTQVRGGDGGLAELGTLDGRGGPGYRGTGGVTWHSGVDFAGGLSPSGAIAAPVEGGLLHALDPAQARLEPLGDPGVVRELRFLLHAPPGSIAELALGTEPAVLGGSSLVGDLVVARAVIPLGVVPPSGELPVTLLAPARGQPLALVVVQARLPDTPGRPQATSSLHWIVR